MHMVTTDRSRVDRHLQTARDLAQQLARSLSNITDQNRVAILRDPHQRVLTIPDRVAPALEILHARTLAG